MDKISELKEKHSAVIEDYQQRYKTVLDKLTENQKQPESKPKKSARAKKPPVAAESPEIKTESKD